MSRRRGGWVAFAIALLVRLGVAVWAAPRFPAAADGVYYDTLAHRLADGHGYTWLWPDGAVTNVAHYPVGYPALLALSYLVLGARPFSAMLLNALFGGAMAYGVHECVAHSLPADSAGGPVGGFLPTHAPLLASLLVALHPALVPYTAALMTESLAASLLVLAAVPLVRPSLRPRSALVLAGLALGLATLVRPQSILFAPLLGLLAPLAPATWLARARAALAVTAVALACCAPWTARNCVAMHQCALVSVNGGWNLLIGTQTLHGGWQPVDVPEECRTVWDEAAKDACFAHAARASIARAPLAWLARAPAKLAVTFDYFGAAPWYLHESSPSAFDERAKTALGVVETVASTLLLLFALGATAWAEGPRRPLRVALAVTGVVAAAISLHPSLAYGALALAILAFGPAYLARAPLLVPWTAVVLVVTAITHAVFFGAGRYGLVVVPFVTALPFVLRLRSPVEGARPPEPTSRRRSPVFIN